jgi:hypothetical protein
MTTIVRAAKYLFERQRYKSDLARRLAEARQLTTPFSKQPELVEFSVRNGKSRVRAINFATLFRRHSCNFSRNRKRYQTNTVSHWLRK